MKQIPLTQGQFALVDDEDFTRLNKYKWQAQKSPKGYYATRNQSFLGLYGDYRKRDRLTSPITIKISMSRQVLGLCTEDAREPDHKNHITLDNQKSNLRIATRQQNQWNSRRRVGKSGFIGVTQIKNKRYIATIMGNDGANNIFIGTFDTAKQAADARDKKAIELRGDFAVLNQAS